MEESDTVFTADDRIPNSHTPFGHPFQAYAASKVNALNATDKFVKSPLRSHKYYAQLLHR